MSRDTVYHGKRARTEISAAFRSDTVEARTVHFDLAGLHIKKMYESAEDAIDRIEANCVAAVLGYWRRRFSEASGHVSGAEMVRRLRQPVTPVESPQPQPAPGPMLSAAMA